MIHLVTPDRYGEHTGALAEMYRLRYRVFKQRLGWEVDSSAGMEIDAFDALHPVYLLQCAHDGGRIQGCVRLLPTTGPTMLAATFAALLDRRPAPADPVIWESSRFALDIARAGRPEAGGLSAATYELLAGMVEFGLSRRLSSFVTVTDLRLERILRRAGWPLRRLGSPKPLGGMLAVAGHLQVSRGSLARIRRRGGLSGPVLQAPARRALA
jgi:acyl homoserine lactone synthase